MNFDIIIVLSTVVFICLLTFIVTKLRKEELVTTEDLIIVQNLFLLTVSIIDELNIKNEEKILQISNIVIMALEYAVGVSIGTEDVIQLAIEKSYELFDEINLELTESRKLLLEQLITIGLSNRYLQDNNGRFTLQVIQ